MKYKYYIFCVWYIVVGVAIAIYVNHYLQPILSYQEGWRTFFYDMSFVSQTINDSGIVSLAECFVLQFFHSSWLGITFLTLILLCLLALVHLICKGLSRKIKNDYVRTSIIVLVQVAILSGIVLNMSNNVKHNMLYAQLSNMSRNGQWDDIISLCGDNSPVNNLLNQNILNMALAEKCQLGDKLLDQPVIDIRSIYVSEIQTAEVAGLLSDVYFSMGHIAQSQMYAFETNEKMGNFSPRMLQRLAITNILYGSYNVARKYLYWLTKTIYYKEWAESYLSLIDTNTIAKDKVINEKRRCIFPDNRFSGIKGIDDDLLNVARNTRNTHQCRVTLQYLGSLYILSGYKEQFIAMVNEFGGSKDMPEPLPKFFNGYYKHLTKK